MPTILITAWSQRWRLSADKVQCRGCEVEQSVEDKTQPFEHRENCPFSEDKRNPWRDLDSAMEALKGRRPQ